MNAVKRIVSVTLLLSILVCPEATGQTARGSTSTTLPDTSPGDVSIRLSNVADSLSFPSSEGANRILSATIRGGDVGLVWLALSRTSSPRVVLTRVTLTAQMVTGIWLCFSVFFKMRH